MLLTIFECFMWQGVKFIHLLNTRDPHNALWWKALHVLPFSFISHLLSSASWSGSCVQSFFSVLPTPLSFHTQTNPPLQTHTKCTPTLTLHQPVISKFPEIVTWSPLIDQDEAAKSKLPDFLLLAVEMLLCYLESKVIDFRASRIDK